MKIIILTISLLVSYVSVGQPDIIFANSIGG